MLFGISVDYAERVASPDGRSTQAQPGIAAAVRTIIREQIRISTDVDALPVDADLFRSGLTSHASVNLMLALESAFDVEFPDEMLKRSTFESIESISEAIAELQDRGVGA